LDSLLRWRASKRLRRYRQMNIPMPTDPELDAVRRKRSVRTPAEKEAECDLPTDRAKTQFEAHRLNDVRVPRPPGTVITELFVCPRR
jgi:hypothetical protein